MTERYVNLRAYLFVLLIFSFAALVAAQDDWLYYIFHLKQTQIVEAEIISFERVQYGSDWRTIRESAILYVEGYGNCALSLSFTDYIHKKIKIGILQDGSPVRLYPRIVMPVDSAGFYTIIVWTATFICFINVIKLRPLYMEEKMKVLKEWQEEQWKE